MLVTCTECDTSFTLEDSGIKKSGSKVRCSRCKNIFVVYPPGSDSTSGIPESFAEEFEDLEPGSGMEGELSEGEEIDFDELDKMLETGDDLELVEASEEVEEEPALPGVGDIDFSELEKALDMDESLKAVETGVTGEIEEKPVEEELDFDELDKALGIDEKQELEELPNITEEKSVIKGTDDIGLSELEKALDKDEFPDSGKDDFDFAELEKESGADEEVEPEEVYEFLEEEPSAPGEGDAGRTGLDKTSGTDEVVKDGKTPGTEELVFDELDKMFGTDDMLAEKGIPESGDKETELSGAGDLDFSELDNLLDVEKTPAAEAVAVKEEKESGFFDTEDIDFSDLEKMLETGEIKLDDMGLEKKGGKTGQGAGEEFDLLDLETAIDKSGEEGIEELEEEPEELKLDFEPEKDEILSKFEDVEEIDFSDLEDMAVSGEAVKQPEKQDEEAEEIDLDFDLDEEPAGKKETAGETADLDLSDLDKIISGANEPDDDISLEKAAEELELDLALDAEADESPAGEESGKAYQDTQELDFSDLENMLVGEKPDGEKGEDAEQKLEFDLDLSSSEAEAEEHADEVTELDFSDVDKMLEMEGTAGEQEAEGEVFELQLGADDSTAGQKADKFADTLVSDGLGLKFSSEESEHEDVHKHLEGFEIDKFQDTMVIGEKKHTVVSEVEEKKDIKKAKVPLKTKKFSGRLTIILGIIAAILLGTGAFVIYNPFGIEIPFVSDFLDSKADPKGNLKITPVTNSINGDYVDTKYGTLFVIRGNVKNDYKHPRSYIRVTGKLFTKGKKLSGTEMVYCGNILSDQDIANFEPALLKKRLLNRGGDKKSNVKVKPGGTIPFMIIYEKPSQDLDEFTVEAESSIKE
jgi:predicted Zn finger-like uncharacterized protein